MNVVERKNTSLPFYCSCCEKEVKHGGAYVSIEHKNLDIELTKECFEEFKIECSKLYIK